MNGPVFGRTRKPRRIQAGGRVRGRDVGLERDGLGLCGRLGVCNRQRHPCIRRTFQVVDEQEGNVVAEDVGLLVKAQGRCSLRPERSALGELANGLRLILQIVVRFIRSICGVEAGVEARDIAIVLERERVHETGSLLVQNRGALY